MIERIFPLKLYLHIFQLEDYQPERLLAWVFRNFTARKVGGKKPLVWTLRAQLLFLFGVTFTLLAPLVIYFLTGNLLFSLVVGGILVSQPYIQLVLLAIVVQPYLFWEKEKQISLTRTKLRRLKVEVIGITGSFAKTSVKEILYQILRTKYSVLRTPGNYNTVSGIAKVIDLELDESYDFFICEMAAYQKGEIAQLTRIVQPKYGILTGIAEQHLERFGTLKNIIETKFELIKSLPKDGFAVLNGDNDLIVSELTPNHPNIPYSLYGIDNKDAQIRATNIKFGEFGSEFLLSTPQGKKRIKTKLLGKSNIQNILGVIAMALHLGVALDEIAKAVENLSPIPNRLELIDKDGLLIINDSYNSNPVGFKEAVDSVKSFKKKNKILITPGIVELGERTLGIHKELGNYAAGIFTKVILVGKSNRTLGLEEGLKDRNFKNMLVVSTLDEAMRLLPKDVKNTVILLENDLPDQY